MAGFIVTYDLPSRNYEGMEAAIKAAGAYCKIATTTWLVKGAFSADDLLSYLARQCLPDGRVIVMDGEGRVAWHGLPDPVVNWIRAEW